MSTRETANARAAIAGDFAAALAADFKEHGVAAIARLREKDIAAYLRLVAAIEPTEAQGRSLSDLSDKEVIDYLDVLGRIQAQMEGDGERPPPRSAFAEATANTCGNDESG